MLRLMHSVIERTNQERIKAHVPPLKAQAELTRAALIHASDMVQHGYFGHSTPDGKGYEEYTRNCRYSGVVGENLFQGKPIAQDILQAWLNSPEHRKNLLLAQHREVGVGFKRGATANETVCVQLLGTRNDVFPVIINNEAYETGNVTVQLYIHGGENIQKMRFSNDGINYSEWETYKPDRIWILTGKERLCSVYVQLSDGETTYTSSDTIFFKAAPPNN